MMLLAFLSLAVGLTLDTVTRGRQEMKRLVYLGIPGISSAMDARCKEEISPKTLANE